LDWDEVRLREGRVAHTAFRGAVVPSIGVVVIEEQGA
jgi:hypothetical protein